AGLPRESSAKSCANPTVNYQCWQSLPFRASAAPCVKIKTIIFYTSTEPRLASLCCRFACHAESGGVFILLLPGLNLFLFVESHLLPHPSLAFLSSSTMRVYPPVAGGPVYWWLRNTFLAARRSRNRIARAFELNWDMTKFACNGVPKTSYNPRVNEWVWNVDTDLWNGVGGQAWWYVGAQAMFTFYWAFALYTVVERWHVNGRIDSWSKWKNRPTD
ncbi:membrane protein, partial [Cystoisospora suis]